MTLRLRHAAAEFDAPAATSFSMLTSAYEMPPPFYADAVYIFISPDEF